jgi:hypothetical protein
MRFVCELSNTRSFLFLVRMSEKYIPDNTCFHCRGLCGGKHQTCVRRENMKFPDTTIPIISRKSLNQHISSEHPNHKTVTGRRLKNTPESHESEKTKALELYASGENNIDLQVAEAKQRQMHQIT